MRTHRKARERKRPWSADEEAILMQLHAVNGNSYVTIAQALPGRTPLDVKNAYYSTRRLKTDGVRSLLRAYIHALKGRDDDPHARSKALATATAAMSESIAQVDESPLGDESQQAVTADTIAPGSPLLTSHPPSQRPSALRTSARRQGAAARTPPHHKGRDSEPRRQQRRPRLRRCRDNNSTGGSGSDGSRSNVDKHERSCGYDEEGEEADCSAPQQPPPPLPQVGNSLDAPSAAYSGDVAATAQRPIRDSGGTGSGQPQAQLSVPYQGGQAAGTADSGEGVRCRNDQLPQQLPPPPPPPPQVEQQQQQQWGTGWELRLGRGEEQGQQRAGELPWLRVLQGRSSVPVCPAGGENPYGNGWVPAHRQGRTANGSEAFKCRHAAARAGCGGGGSHDSRPAHSLCDSRGNNGCPGQQQPLPPPPLMSPLDRRAPCCDGPSSTTTSCCPSRPIYTPDHHRHAPGSSLQLQPPLKRRACRGGIGTAGGCGSSSNSPMPAGAQPQGTPVVGAVAAAAKAGGGGSAQLPAVHPEQQQQQPLWAGYVAGARPAALEACREGCGRRQLQLEQQEQPSGRLSSPGCAQHPTPHPTSDCAPSVAVPARARADNVAASCSEPQHPDNQLQGPPRQQQWLQDRSTPWATGVGDLREVPHPHQILYEMHCSQTRPLHSSDGSAEAVPQVCHAPQQQAQWQPLSHSRSGSLTSHTIWRDAAPMGVVQAGDTAVAGGWPHTTDTSTLKIGQYHHHDHCEQQQERRQQKEHGAGPHRSMGDDKRRVSSGSHAAQLCRTGMYGSRYNQPYQASASWVSDPSPAAGLDPLQLQQHYQHPAAEPACHIATQLQGERRIMSVSPSALSLLRPVGRQAACDPWVCDAGFDAWVGGAASDPWVGGSVGDVVPLGLDDAELLAMIE